MGTGQQEIGTSGGYFLAICRTDVCFTSKPLFIF